MNSKERKEIIRAIDVASRHDGYRFVGWEARALKELRRIGYDFCKLEPRKKESKP